MTGPTPVRRIKALNLKTRLSAPALLLPLALATLTGCSMTDTDDSHGIPSAGTSTSEKAADEAKKVSSELYDLIDIKGKTSKTGAGVTECAGKDREKYFQIFHPGASLRHRPTSSMV